MSNEFSDVERDSLDQQFVESLLEATHFNDQKKARLDELVDVTLKQIQQSIGCRVTQTPSDLLSIRRRLTQGLIALAATLLASVGGWLLFGATNSAQAAVFEVLERTLSSGPVRYATEFTFVGPVLGEFERPGACYLDGSKRFVFEIPSPFGFEDRKWVLASDGERIWGKFPSGKVWISQGDELETWWQSRGLGDVPILHVEAVLVSFGETYQLLQSHSESGDLIIRGNVD